MSKEIEMYASLLANFNGDVVNDNHRSLAAMLRAVSYKKGDVIFKQGDVCREFFYIQSGLLRTVYIFKDKEVNLRFLCDGGVALAASSHILQSPSHEYIECVEDSHGVKFSLQDLSELRKNPAFLKFELLLTQQHYLALERRLKMLQYKKLEERYAFFVEEMDEKIVQRMPHYHVASYLGSTPESFSRMRSQLKR